MFENLNCCPSCESGSTPSQGIGAYLSPLEIAAARSVGANSLRALRLGFTPIPAGQAVISAGGVAKLKAIQGLGSWKNRRGLGSWRTRHGFVGFGFTPIPAGKAVISAAGVAKLQSIAGLGLRDSSKLYRPARRFSGLGTSPIVGTVASKGAGLAAGAATTAVIGTTAGTAGGALLGAAAGSVVPIVGTIVGAIVGVLASRLFGHANYAQIAADVASRLKMAQAYQQVYGYFPGRMYGSNELLQIFMGLVHMDTFPKNWGGGTCNVNACIAAGAAGTQGQCANCGGSEQWVDDIFTGLPVTSTTSGTGNPGGVATQSILGALKAAQAQGLSDPTVIADQILIPAWAGADSKYNVKWAYPGNSNNAPLVRQLFIDCLDAAAAATNPNLSVYYGTGITTLSATPTPTVTPITAGATPESISTAGTMTVGGVTYTSGPSGWTDPNGNVYLWNGSSMVPQSTVVAGPAYTPGILTGQGWVLNGTDAASGNPVYTKSGLVPQMLLPNGSLQNFTGTLPSVVAANASAGLPAPVPVTSPLAPVSVIPPTSSAGTPLPGTVSTTPLPPGAQPLVGGGYVTQSGQIVAGPASAATAAQLSPNNSSISAGTSGTLTTAQGTWSFSPQSDGLGNELILLNGIATGGVGTQLAILNNTPTTLHADGSTWGWSGSSWSQLSAATSQAPTAIPSLSQSALAPVSVNPFSATTPSIPQPVYAPYGYDANGNPLPAPTAAPTSATGAAPQVPAPATAGLSSVSPMTLAIVGAVALMFALAKPGKASKSDKRHAQRMSRMFGNSK